MGFMDEPCKPCELLKVLRLSETLLPTETAQLFTSDDLLLLVLKRWNLFDENCDGVQYFGNCYDNIQVST